MRYRSGFRRSNGLVWGRVIKLKMGGRWFGRWVGFSFGYARFFREISFLFINGVEDVEVKMSDFCFYVRIFGLELVFVILKEVSRGRRGEISVGLSVFVRFLDTVFGVLDFKR